MRNIKVEFSVSTKYVGSRVKEIVDLEIDEDLNEHQIEEIIEEAYESWLENNCDRYYNIVE